MSQCYLELLTPFVSIRAKLANIVATLDELSYGRADLAIGAGEIMNVVDYGMQWREHPKIRLSQLKEAIIVIVDYYGSNLQHPFSFDGEFFRLKNARLNQHHRDTEKLLLEHSWERGLQNSSKKERSGDGGIQHSIRLNCLGSAVQL